MKKMIFTIFIIVLGFSVICGQNVTSNKTEVWKEFVSKEAGFKVLFPVEPTFSSAVVMSTPVKRTNHRFEVSLSRGYFAVHYSDHPLLPNLDGEDLKADYDFLKNNLVKAIKAEIIKEREVSLGKYSGREILYRIKDEAIIDIFFLVNKRLYQNIVAISYADLENKTMQAEINKFFDSFVLIENDQK